MTCSPARLAANLANSKRSTGPRTAEGKAASSRNAYQHGMTGQGVVLPPGEEAEVEAATAQLVAQMKPSGLMGRILLKRIAVFSARLDKCDRHDAAMAAKRVRDAEKHRDEARRDEVDALLSGLKSDPDRALKRLMEMPEGIDGLIEAWQLLRGQLARPRKFAWSDQHDEQVDNLLGRHAGIHPPTQFDPILRAIRGDFSGLSDDQGAGLGRQGRKKWAREQLAALIDGEVQALRELRVLIDDEAEAADRAKAGDRALFDPSKEGQLARKYAAAAERGLFRALREFREVEARNEPNAAPETPPPPPAIRPEPRPRVAAAPAAPAPIAPAPASARDPIAPSMPAQTKPTDGPGLSATGGPGGSGNA